MYPNYYYKLEQMLSLCLEFRKKDTGLFGEFVPKFETCFKYTLTLTVSDIWPPSTFQM